MPDGTVDSLPQAQAPREPSNISNGGTTKQSEAKRSAPTAGTTLASAYKVLPARSAAIVLTHGNPTIWSSEALSPSTLEELPMPIHCSSKRVLLRLGSASTWAVLLVHAIPASGLTRR